MTTEQIAYLQGYFMGALTVMIMVFAFFFFFVDPECVHGGNGLKTSHASEMEP